MTLKRHFRSSSIESVNELNGIQEDELDSFEYPQEKLIPLMIAQLKSYGYYSAAKFLADTSSTSNVYEASNKLANLVQAGHEQLRGELDDDDDQNGLLMEPGVGNGLDDGSSVELGQLVYEDGVEYKTKEPLRYHVWFSTTHKGACTATAFSPDGQFFATGSADTTLKIVETSRITSPQSQQNNDEKKVIRTLYDHSAPVNELAFHPNGLTLASCSDDTTIKLYDMNRTNVKRGFRFLPDAYPVHSIAFHPSGDFLLSGTDHQAVRIFDVHSLKCFVPSNPNDHHAGRINRVAYSPSGSIFSTCSRDGSIKIYDTITSRCINTIPKAHDGFSVSGITFSKNGDYLLSTGLDSKGKLWDMRSGKVLVTYGGAGIRSESSRFCFVTGAAEGYVLGSDENLGSVVLWDTMTGAVLNKFASHGKPIRTLAPSPVNLGFVSGGDDNKAKYWNVSGSSH